MAASISPFPIEEFTKADSAGSLTLYTSDSHARYRSVITDGNTPISHFFPPTKDFTELDIFPILDCDFKDWLWFESYEGTIIRMFYHDGHWKTSTRRRLDAHNSYWGSNISFGEMFDIAFANTSKEGLDKELTYTFLLSSNSHNRLVCKPNPVPLYFTGAFDKNGSYQISSNNTLEGCEYTRNIYFTDENALRIAVFNVDIDTSQGFIGFNTKTGEFIKIVNSKYNYKRSLRNNEPDIRARYLQTLCDPNLHRNFREHFYEHARLFRRLDGSFHGLIRDILHETPKECDGAIMEIHNSNVKNTHKNIASWLSSLNTDILWKPIIFRLKNCRNVKEVPVRDAQTVLNELMTDVVTVPGV